MVRTYRARLPIKVSRAVTRRTYVLVVPHGYHSERGGRRRRRRRGAFVADVGLFRAWVLLFFAAPDETVLILFVGDG